MEENQNEQTVDNGNELQGQVTEIQPVEETQETSAVATIDLEALQQEQNYLMGTLGALGAALVGAILWAVVTVATEHQIGYMALAIGLMVGFANRFLGKGMELKFGITGALLALVGCVLGNIFSLIGFVAQELGVGYFDALSFIDFGLIPDAMMEAFSPIDLLFYGIAMYEGFKFSFRVVETEENA
ncbi:MAG: hypothetical protein ACOVP9_07170 [Flavobacterium stagni]